MGDCFILYLPFYPFNHPYKFPNSKVREEILPEKSTILNLPYLCMKKEIPERRQPEDKVVGLEIAEELMKLQYIPLHKQDKWGWFLEDNGEWKVKKVRPIEVVSARRYLPAPTLEVARVWAREKLGIFPTVRRRKDCSEEGREYWILGLGKVVRVYCRSQIQSIQDIDWIYSTKKEAYEEGIKKAIKYYLQENGKRRQN